MPEFDPYSVLGVQKTSSSTEIKKAYRSLAMKFHPDKNNNKEEHDKFKDIAHAYDILSDPEKRKQHDLRSKQKSQPTFKRSSPFKRANPAFNHSSGFSFQSSFNANPSYNFYQAHAHPRPGFFTADNFFGDSMFSDFFASSTQREGSHRARARPQAQPEERQPEERQNQPLNVEKTVNIQLKDLYNGKKVTVTHPVKSICPGCNGDTRRKVIQQPCGVCKGHGYMRYKSKATKISSTPCKACKGSGKERVYTSCGQCHGQNITTERDLTFVIPKGHPKDKPIIFKNEAGLLGDLIVRFQIMDWNGFGIKGNHLYRKTTITLQEALFGFDKVLFTHMDGRQIKVKHPAGDVIKPGTCKRILREGMPKPIGGANGDEEYNGGVQEKGDLFVEFDVDFPDKLDLPSDISRLKSCFPEPFVVTEDGPVEECVLHDSNTSEFMPEKKPQEEEEKKKKDDDDATDNNEGDETDELDEEEMDDEFDEDLSHIHLGEDQNGRECIIM